MLLPCTTSLKNLSQPAVIFRQNTDLAADSFPHEVPPSGGGNHRADDWDEVADSGTSAFSRVGGDFATPTPADPDLPFPASDSSRGSFALGGLAMDDRGSEK